MSEYRLEKDSIGVKEVPKEAYYGVQALRGAENFNITGLRLHPEMIRSLAEVKKASAIANKEAGLMQQNVCSAIVQACDEILDGKLHDAFIVDPIQGGAGTSMNMNANEVIANRAIELLGGEKGDYSLVHPNDHVNFGQSTNDVIPTAGKITAIRLSQALLSELDRLTAALERKSEEFDGVLKMGRTQMQDAVPIRLGQEFHAYASAVKRSTARIRTAVQELYTVNMGGTAIGTGLNADETYFRTVVPTLSEVTGLPLKQADDLIDATQHLDSFTAVSGALKATAVALSKIANDLRLMSSGPRTGFGEISLPARQNGSSIMPGKVNPVIPEVVSQAAFQVMGSDCTIQMAAEAGQLELNAFEPVLFFNLFLSMDVLKNAVSTFIDNCISGITANEDRCRALVEQSVGVITALCPHVGYQKAAEAAKKALKTGKPVRAVILEEGLMKEEDLCRVLDAFAMTQPGIAAKDLLK